MSLPRWAVPAGLVAAVGAIVWSRRSERLPPMPDVGDLVTLRLRDAGRLAGYTSGPTIAEGTATFVVKQVGDPLIAVITLVVVSNTPSPLADLVARDPLTIPLSAIQWIANAAGERKWTR